MIILFGGLYINGNFVQYEQLRLGGKFKENVGGACDEESATHSSCTMGTGLLSRGQSGRGVALTTHPHPAPRPKKE
jgi:hypothetical protein